MSGAEWSLLVGSVLFALLLLAAAALWWAGRRLFAQQDRSSQAVLDAYRAGQADAYWACTGDNLLPDRMWVAETMPGDVAAHNAAVVEAEQVMADAVRALAVEMPEARLWLPEQRDERGL